MTIYSIGKAIAELDEIRERLADRNLRDVQDVIDDVEDFLTALKRFKRDQDHD